MRSNSTQQAGLLNQILQAAGPAVLGAAGGALTKMLQPGSNQVTAAQASSLRPEQVRDIAAAAQQNSPSVMDQVGRFYCGSPNAHQDDRRRGANDRSGTDEAEMDNR